MSIFFVYDFKFYFIRLRNTVEPLLSDPLGEEQLVQIIEGLDNTRAKIIGLNGVGRVGLRSDN